MAGTGHAIQVPSKQCTRCETVKPLTDFLRVKWGLDGRHTECRSCRNKYCYAQQQRNSATATRAFTALNDARLMALLVVGVPREPAGILLGISKRSVEFRLERLASAYPEIAPHFWHPVKPVWFGQRLAELERLISEGRSRSQAARHFGCTRNAIFGAIKRHLPHLMYKKTRPCPSLHRLEAQP